MNSYIACVPS